MVSSLLSPGGVCFRLRLTLGLRYKILKLAGGGVGILLFVLLPRFVIAPDLFLLQAHICVLLSSIEIVLIALTSLSFALKVLSPLPIDVLLLLSAQFILLLLVGTISLRLLACLRFSRFVLSLLIGALSVLAALFLSLARLLFAKLLIVVEGHGSSL